jgi:signal transduction histidine kinase
MKKYFALLLILNSALVVSAQYQVRFILNEMTSIKHDSIFISGSFNNWDSLANPQYKLQSYGGGKHSIVLNLPGGDFEYKYTRGNWLTVEQTWYGLDVPNSKITVHGDTTVRDSVFAWRDLILEDKLDLLTKKQNDTDRINILTSLASEYASYSQVARPDSVLYYTQQALQRLTEINSLHKEGAMTPAEYSSWRMLQLQGLTANLLQNKNNLLAKENQIKVLELSKEALIKKVLIGSILFLLVLAFIVVRNISLKRKNEKHRRELAENELRIQKLEGEKAKAELQRQAAELEIKAMVAAQEQERKRISRDLHDDVGTKLSALNLFLSSLDEKAKNINNDEIRSLTQSSKQFIKEAMYDIRQLLFDLSPTVLEEFGYTAAVEGLVNKINETKQIHFDLIVCSMDHRLKKDYELALYRITQELINNVLKHAEAKNVLLQIEHRDGKIILMMVDDGKGFDVNAHKDGYGLNNLEARTKLMQGIMTIDSQVGKGTSVQIEIPYNFNGS